MFNDLEPNIKLLTESFKFLLDSKKIKDLL